ncbi:MAG: Signal transduction histidine kinase [Parcubacteria group bacterium GW2011_GWE2_39_37]|uniref:histidine kinase n=1 Tax=Candidatus Falkowbacteria bacterium GW2011_GWF2_39_8 TaxID=1618642 RepID=A0A0G0PWA6_9BACT|nr:MAG: Signal transduction histidine kinase [Parcubacteria group bacterium GW2011_GWE2_39_37]KKR32183.1 MAG: Signal transduction histidine kinase [Candidatus Falkowbacteria bacterium GW2011_GWF2_39_8]
MNSFAFSSIFTSILSFGLAFFVIYKNYKSTLNRSWFFVSFLMGVWSLGLWGVVVSSTYIEALFFQYILDLSAVFIPLSFFKFSINLLKINDKKRKQFVIFSILSCLIALMSFTSLFKKGMAPLLEYNFNFWINPGSLYPVFPLYFSLLMFYSFYLIIVNFKNFNGAERSQIRYILIAGIIGFLGGATNFFPQVIKIYPVGNYFVILYIVSVAYAILKHRLMGIRTIASKVYTYILASTFVFIVFYSIVSIEEKYLSGIFSSISLTINVLVAVLFSNAFIFILEKIQKSSDQIFFKGRTPQKILKELSLRLSSSINIDKLMSILSHEFKKILATEDIDVFLFQKDTVSKSGKEKYAFVSILNNKGKIVSSNIISETVLNNKAALVRDEAEKRGEAKLVEQLDKLKAKIVAPLIMRDKVIGLILLGGKISDDAYTQEDIEFLEIISSQAAVAIENARLYKEVDDFSKTLQQKVDEQTQELKDKAEHMKKLMEMRSEFLDITSHQLRTPVSVIKGVLSMMQEGSIPENKKAEFLNAAMDKSIKLGEIINDILRASEMDSDKFTMNVRAVDLNEILEKIKSDKMKTSLVRNVVLTFNFTKEPLPPVMTDEKYIEQAIVNLINNAFQYTPEGTITVTTSADKDFVTIRVADTGIGIPDKDRKKMFQKFGRAENAKEAFTDGSGLGLFIIKQIVDANPGSKIEIEKTEVGKGTTFALTLPVARGTV